MQKRSKNTGLFGLCVIFCAMCSNFAVLAKVMGQESGFPTVPQGLVFEGPAAKSNNEVPADPGHVDRVAQLTDDDFSFEMPTLDPSTLPTVGSPFSGTQSSPEPQAELETLSVPIARMNRPEGELQVVSRDQTVSIYAQSVDLRIVLSHLADESRINIVVAEDVVGTITTTLVDVPLWEALDAILKINGLVWIQKENIIFVTKPVATEGEAATGSLPGQVLQVFDLNYTSATEVLEVVNGLLSPAGRAFVHAVDISSTRQTRERIVVEDYPERIHSVSAYLASVDNPPRQVLLEAHVLQVTLDDNQRHGVNLLGIARLAGARVNVQAQGFANGAASPGFMMGVEGGDLDGMIETLRSNSNVRTLAAPKVMVVNGQEARIQIGSKFGYFVTTTTQTSTLQSVDFLDIGVVLQVQPTITQDGQVLLTVAPKVSGGRINPDNGLPEEDTTEASTTVLLPDGKGMIIGGLIKESDIHNESWVPWLGKQPFIGKLFSRASDETERVEVIIALTTHIVPYGNMINHREHQDYCEATSSTLVGDYYITGEHLFPLPSTEQSVAPGGPPGMIESPVRAYGAPGEYPAATPSTPANGSSFGAPNQAPTSAPLNAFPTNRGFAPSAQYQRPVIQVAPNIQANSSGRVPVRTVSHVTAPPQHSNAGRVFQQQPAYRQQPMRQPQAAFQQPVGYQQRAVYQQPAESQQLGPTPQGAAPQGAMWR